MKHGKNNVHFRTVFTTKNNVKFIFVSKTYCYKNQSGKKISGIGNTVVVQKHDKK